jgi:LuxR family maltose regulon positive regulatory protein
LRFTSPEAAEFLNKVMGLDLSSEDIASLETRTEGWIAGLQLAAISLQGHKDATDLIKSFTGSHRLVLDYLIEEVLDQQPEDIQTFLLQTAILNQMTGSLCDALTGKNNGQQTLEYLEQVNLFIVSLDEERRWYRYHHLFADLLRQRLHQRTASSKGDEGGSVAEYHIRASVWYENNGLEIEAFQHAVSANDVEQAARLVEGDGGMPLHYRGAVTPILNWLESLPTAELEVRPSLWVMYASVLMFTGQTGVEEKLQAAESALGGADLDAKTRDLVGHIAATRAMLAVPQHHVETIIAQSRRALKFLHPDNLPVRTATNWALGWAYQLQGDRTAAKQAFVEVISIGQASGNTLFTIGATTSVGQLQEAENQLYQAAETYWSVLQMAGDHPLPVACEAHLGLAHVFYEWNDVDAAQEHGKQSVQFARQLENTGSFIPCEVFLARLKLTQGNDVTGAATILAEVEQGMRQHDFVHRMPEIAAVQVLTFLRQGNLVAAAHLAKKHELPISQARVHLAQGDSSAALAMLEPYRRQMEKKDWADERLKVMVLQAVAHYAHGEEDKAAQLMGDALALAEPGGFIRIFVDEGPPMERLLYEALSRGIAPDYVQQLLAAFPSTPAKETASSKSQDPEAEWVEPLSERELDVLQLIAEGLTNQEVGSRLYLTLNTIKAHTRNIYSKLGVNSRTQAVARARALGILKSN